jgi:hypothetical protein
MLAGVSVVIMGAGIPLEIPGALTALAEDRPATIRLRAGNRQGAGAVPGQYSDISAPSSMMRRADKGVF